MSRFCFARSPALQHLQGGNLIAPSTTAPAPHPDPCSYLIHDNFHIYGGHKSDFDGHAKRSYNNVALYSYVYGDHCECGATGQRWCVRPG